MASPAATLPVLPGAAEGMPHFRVGLVAVFALDAISALVVFAYGTTYLIETLDAPNSYPALALAIFGLVRLVAAPAGGRILDERPAAALLAIAAALLAGGLAVILATHTREGYLAGVAGISAALGFAWLVLFDALGRGTTPEGRANYTGTVSFVSTCATGAGFLAAGAFSETTWWPAPFAVGLGLGAVAFWALLQMAPAGPHRRGAAPSPALAAVPGVDSGSRPVAVTLFAHAAAVSGLAALFAPFALRTLDLALIEAGALLIPATVVGGAMLFVAGRLSRPGRRLREVAAMYVFGVLSSAALAAVSSPLAFLLAAIPLGIALGGVAPVLSAAIIDVSYARDRPGQALGWMFFAQGSGSVAGPAAMSVLLALASPRLGFAFVAAVCALLAAFAFTAERRAHRG